MEDNVQIATGQIVATEDNPNGFTSEQIAEQQRLLLLLLDI